MHNRQRKPEKEWNRPARRFVSGGSTIQPLGGRVESSRIKSTRVPRELLLRRPKDRALITLPPLLPLRFIVVVVVVVVVVDDGKVPREGWHRPRRERFLATARSRLRK